MLLSRGTRIQVWLRLLLLQGSWNFERLQGLGFFYAILPALKKIYGPDKLPGVCRRHLRYFNTHPYLAPTVAGAVLKLEEQAGTGQEEVDIDGFKDTVAAPYAAIGDALFWGGLRPLAAGIALLIAAKGILWAPLVFLLLFNLVPIWFRTAGYVRSYRQGVRSVEFIQRRRLPDWAIHTKEAAIVVFGGFTALLVFQHLQQLQLARWLGFFAVIPIILVGLFARKGVSTLFLTLLTAVVIMLSCLFWADVAGWFVM